MYNKMMTAMNKTHGFGPGVYPTGEDNCYLFKKIFLHFFNYTKKHFLRRKNLMLHLLSLKISSWNSYATFSPWKLGRFFFASLFLLQSFMAHYTH